MCDHRSLSPVADVCVAGHRNDCRSVWDQIIVSIIWNLLRLPLDWIKWPSGSSSLHGLMRSWWSSSPATNTKLSLLPAPPPRLRTDQHSSIFSSCAMCIMHQVAHFFIGNSFHALESRISQFRNLSNQFILLPKIWHWFGEETHVNPNQADTSDHSSEISSGVFIALLMKGGHRVRGTSGVTALRPFAS